MQTFWNCLKPWKKAFEIAVALALSFEMNPLILAVFYLLKNQKKEKNKVFLYIWERETHFVFGKNIFKSS